MSDMGRIFGISKATGTHSEVLAAVGLADLLTELGVPGVLIRNVSAAFEVEAGLPVVDYLERLNHVPQAPGYPFLKANARVEVPGGVLDVVDYETEKARVDRFRKLVGGRSGRTKGRAAVQEALDEAAEHDRPRSDWRLLQALNTLQGDEIANKIHVRITRTDPGVFRRQLQAALSNLANGRPSSLDWEKSSVQLFTPSLAKGYARLKPDSIDRNDKTKEQWADPFVDWLKYRGYFRIACPFFVGSKGEDIRLLVPVPGAITVPALREAASLLRRAGVFGGSTKVDVLAVVSLALILIEHSEEYHRAEDSPFPGLSVKGKRLDEVLSGVMITHYQSLGNARAVSSISTLALPGWFEIADAEDAEMMTQALYEHKAVVRALQDDHSDELGLLIKYRRFLEKRGSLAVQALFEFLEEYGIFWMRAFGSRQDGRKRRLRRFTDMLVRRILMGNTENLSEVLDNPGFQAIARAIRKSTVIALTQKTMGVKEYRDIRYDLLPHLRRKRMLSAGDLVEAVSDFVSSYNWENARIRENSKNMKAAPANVSDADLAAFVGLFDKGWKPSLVGALLAAFGSCKEAHEDVPVPEEGALPEGDDGIDESGSDTVQ